MFSYIIRLDDACANMNHKRWEAIEKLLDKYAVQPIVGIIPDCRDKDESFNNPTDEFFWERANAWQKKGWTIALHGLHHSFHDVSKNVKYFQRNIGTYTEFAGLSYDKQKKMIINGINILKEHGLFPTCFFAPAHTYDQNTVRVCREIKDFKFISDGYALRVFKKSGMVFIPSIFDTPHKMPWGIYTFVFHPSKMDDAGLKYLETFLFNNAQHVIDAETALKSNRRIKNQGLLGITIEMAINYVRRFRNDV